MGTATKRYWELLFYGFGVIPGTLCIARSVAGWQSKWINWLIWVCLLGTLWVGVSKLGTNDDAKKDKDSVNP